MLLIIAYASLPAHLNDTEREAETKEESSLGTTFYDKREVSHMVLGIYSRDQKD